MDGMSADSSAERLCWASALVVSARMGIKDNVGAWGLSTRNKEVIEEWNVHDSTPLLLHANEKGQENNVDGYIVELMCCSWCYWDSRALHQ